MTTILTTPLSVQKTRAIRCGEKVFISGSVYTLRDMSQKKLIGKKACYDLNLKNSVIYYCAPTLSKNTSKPIGACGPTTTARMESGLSELLKMGVKAIIGKGPISNPSQDLLQKNNSVYLIATGGCGAYYSQFVTKAKIILFEELGPEAIWQFELKDFPVIVGFDAKGKDIFNRLTSII